MKYLLDTALLSELVKHTPNPGVLDWVARQEEDSLFVSVLTLGELQKGISKLQDSERRAALQQWLTHDMARRFVNRLLSVDDAVALHWGVLQGEAQQAGTPLPAIDSLLAATARVHDLTVVTRNTSDFQRCGARVIDPW